MFVRVSLVAIALCVLSASVGAQDREQGWELSTFVVYQDPQKITFNGGSIADLDEDIGLSVSATYRLNSRLEFVFGLDWNSVNYDVNIVSSSLPQRSFSGRGDLESFTPNINANFNLFEGPVTPYVTAGAGWSFIDTNIPDAPPQFACWWDPWYGEVCNTYQSTRTTDELTYRLGVGLRWDISEDYVLRLGYAKQWLDLGQATSTPDFDQLKLGVTLKY